MVLFNLIQKDRKAQIWGFDLMIALTIFLVGIIIIYLYAINFSETSQDILNEMNSEAVLVSSLILSEGSPENWDAGNVEIPGILTNKRLNETKLENLENLILDDYHKTKISLGAVNNFYFIFEGIDGVGKEPVSTNNLIKLERLIIYNNKPVKFVLYIWN